MKPTKKRPKSEASPPPATPQQLARETLDPAELQRLADEGDEDVRLQIARNPATPPPVLLQLARHDELLLRWALAAHPQAPPELLRNLAEGRLDQPMVNTLRRNPATPDDLLRRLLIHPPPQHPWDPYTDIVQNPAAPADLLRAATAFSMLRSPVAAHPRTPPELLAELASDAEIDVRGDVASNPLTPPAVLDTLARGRSPKVRLRAAENPSCGLATLEHLIHDARPEVRAAAEDNLRGRTAKPAHRRRG